MIVINSTKRSTHSEGRYVPILGMSTLLQSCLQILFCFQPGEKRGGTYTLVLFSKRSLTTCHSRVKWKISFVSRCMFSLRPRSLILIFERANGFRGKSAESAAKRGFEHVSNNVFRVLCPRAIYNSCKRGHIFRKTIPTYVRALYAHCVCAGT